MNNFIVAPSANPLTSTSAYTVLQSISEGSVPLGPTYKSSLSWRRFIQKSTQQPEFLSVIAVISGERTTTEGPTVLKPAPFPEDYDARKETFRRFLDTLEAEAESTDDVTTEQ